MRRLTMMTLSLVFWAIFPGSAHAADTVTIEVLQAPPTNSALRGDSPFPVTMRAQAASTLKSFQIYIAPAEDAPKEMKVVGGWVGGSWAAGDRSSQDLSLSWNTKSMTPYNGLYRLVATAESHLGATKTLRLEAYAVDNLPMAVSGLLSEVKGDAPSLDWKANRETDLINYRVYRALGSSSYKNVAVTTATAYADEEAPKGVELKYYVTATRRSVMAKQGWVESAPSKATSFFIPFPQSGGQPTISAPQEAPAAPAVPNVKARPPDEIVHRGFGELLPYGTVDNSPFDAPAPLSEEQGPAIFQRKFQAPAPLSLPQVYKPPFFAAALLMIAAAGHLGRLALSIFRGERRPTRHPQTEPVS